MFCSVGLKCYVCTFQEEGPDCLTARNIAQFPGDCRHYDFCRTVLVRKIEPSKSLGSCILVNCLYSTSLDLPGCPFPKASDAFSPCFRFPLVSENLSEFRKNDHSVPFFSQKTFNLLYSFTKKKLTFLYFRGNYAFPPLFPKNILFFPYFLTFSMLSFN